MCYTFLDTFLSIDLEYEKKKIFFHREHWSLTPERQKKHLAIFSTFFFSLIFAWIGEKTHFILFLCQGIFLSKHLVIFSTIFFSLILLDSARKHLFFLMKFFFLKQRLFSTIYLANLWLLQVASGLPDPGKSPHTKQIFERFVELRN